MPNLLEKINETLTQLNEVNDLRNGGGANLIQYIIDFIKNPENKTKYGIKNNNPALLFSVKGAKNDDWNTLYKLAANGNLIANSNVESDKQFVLKFTNIYAGEDGPASEGYLKFSQQFISKIDDGVVGNQITDQDMTLVTSASAASTFNSEDISKINNIFKSLIKSHPTPNTADGTIWYFKKDTRLTKEKLKNDRASQKANGSVPSEFISQLYFYLFLGNTPHENLTGASDKDISKYYIEEMKNNKDKVSTWQKLVNQKSNLTSIDYENLKGIDESENDLIEDIKNLKVGNKSLSEIYGNEESLDQLKTSLKRLKLAWKIDDERFNQNFIDKSFLLPAYLGGLCKDLSEQDLFSLPRIYSNLKRQFNSLKDQYKGRFNSPEDFAQSVLLDTSSKADSSDEYAVQDWDNYLKDVKDGIAIDNKYVRVPSTDPNFTSYKIRSSEEIRTLLNNIFSDQDPEDVENDGNLYFLIRSSDSKDLKANIKLITSPDSDNILIPDNKTLPSNYPTFEFNSNDQLNICYVEEGSSPKWNINNILNASAIKGTIGSKIKKDDATNEPSIAEAVKFDLSKLQVIISESNELKKAKIISIDSGTSTEVHLDDPEDNAEDKPIEPNDGSEKLTDDQIKEAMINWLWSKKPATLKTQEDVRKFIMGEYADFEAAKKAVINEVKAKPDYYTYDNNLKTFAEVKSESELQKLLDKLNDTSRGTEKTKATTGNNIDDVDIPVTERAKPLKMSAQTVRQKLTELAAALAETKDETDLNKVSTETKKKLVSAINNSADLTQIVLWLNKMAGLAKKNK